MIISNKFQVNWPFGSGKEAKMDFQDGRRWISDRNDFSYFDLKVTAMLPTKLQVNWLFGSGEEAKNIFSRWPPWQPSWISDQNDFRYF